VSERFSAEQARTTPPEIGAAVSAANPYMSPRARVVGAPSIDARRVPPRRLKIAMILIAFVNFGGPLFVLSPSAMLYRLGHTGLYVIFVELLELILMLGVLFWLMWRGRSWSRWLYLLLTLMASAPGISTLLSDWGRWVNTIDGLDTIAGSLFTLAVAYLLFTGESKRYFAPKRASLENSQIS
jgi:hypothetical protein